MSWATFLLLVVITPFFYLSSSLQVSPFVGQVQVLLTLAASLTFVCCGRVLTHAGVCSVFTTQPSLAVSGGLAAAWWWWRLLLCGGGRSRSIRHQRKELD
jgi:hypothetical protein